MTMSNKSCWPTLGRSGILALMPFDVPLACICGAVAGVVRGVTPANANRLSCMCDDCQVYAHYLRRADLILDSHGGTDLSYATQARVSILKGREQLQTVRLSATGILRVYAGCCRTPVAHVPSPRVAFVGIPHLFMDDGASSHSRDEVLGPLVHRLQGRYGGGELPEGAHSGTPLSLTVRGLSRMFWDSVRGQQTPSPFHEGARQTPVAIPTVLSPAEIELLRTHLPPSRLSVRTGLASGCS
jgi:hypothetical protein